MSLQEGTISVEAPHLSNNRNWAWSIHPLVFWTRVLTIGILNGNGAETYRSRCIVLYGFLCLSCNIISQAVCLKFIFKDFNRVSETYVNDGEYNSNASGWNTAIDFVNFAVHSVSTHLFLVFFFRPRWILLMNAIENLEPLFNVETFQKLRRISVLCLTYVVFTVTATCVLLAYYHVKRGTSLDVLILGFLSTISQIHPFLMIAMFMVTTYATSYAYKMIYSDLNILSNMTTDSQRYAALLKLKHYHILVCETVDYTNHCFGWIIVFYVAFHYVAAITSSFYLFGQTMSLSPLPYLFLIQHSFHLAVVCLTADFLLCQAERVTKKLAEIQLNVKEPMKSLISAFAAQLRQFAPEVTGVGFFNVNTKIIPKVITTALTYFIILYQFHSSEQEIVQAEHILRRL